MYPFAPKKFLQPLPAYILTKLIWILCGLFIAAFIKMFFIDTSPVDNRVWLVLVIVIFVIMTASTSKRTSHHR